ncbi:MAG: hypothetical protein AAF677_10355 [Pseudomonadota bacterium]
MCYLVFLTFALFIGARTGEGYRMYTQNPDGRRSMRGARFVALLIGAPLALSSCGPSSLIASDDSVAIASVAITRSGVNLSVKGEREVTDVATRASRLTSARLLERPDASRVALAEIPILAQSQDGRSFVMKTGPRALARGAPAAFCPATGLSTSGSVSRQQAAASALRACLGQVRTLPGAPDCGCELVALDDIVLLPRAETAYAIRTAARIKADFLSVDGLFIAEETAPTSIQLRDLYGVIGRVDLQSGNRARLTLRRPDRDPDRNPGRSAGRSPERNPEQRPGRAGGAETGETVVLPGRAILVGTLRGRRTWRLYFDDGAGQRASVLVGFPPAELDAYAAAWLAFPPDGIAGSLDGRGVEGG